jgi:histidinol phosphatase-like PHP family hydrolase
MKRRAFLKHAGMAAGIIAAAPMLSTLQASEAADVFPLMDLHVHVTDKFTLDQALRLAEQRKVKLGIVDHPASWAIKDDADLKKYIDNLRKHPVYVGLQPMISGWDKDFSPAILAQLDYVLMDPQTIPLGNGRYQRIWELETYVEDTDAFMEQYMQHSLNVLNREPINIFGWPLFLPVCIARDYYTLWTDQRMQQIIAAAKARNIAIEINDMAHTPHEKFILMAKEQGLKFTFGSDARNQNAGRLAYCKAVARKCGLKASDFYVPRKKG